VPWYLMPEANHDPAMMAARSFNACFAVVRNGYRRPREVTTAAGGSDGAAAAGQ
jgi:hypothetical protein